VVDPEQNMVVELDPDPCGQVEQDPDETDQLEEDPLSEPNLNCIQRRKQMSLEWPQFGG
jgi:hypothetical protein